MSNKNNTIGSFFETTNSNPIVKLIINIICYILTNYECHMIAVIIARDIVNFFFPDQENNPRRNLQVDNLEQQNNQQENNQNLRQ